MISAVFSPGRGGGTFLQILHETYKNFGHHSRTFSRPYLASKHFLLVLSQFVQYISALVTLCNTLRPPLKSDLIFLITYIRIELSERYSYSFLLYY